MIRASILAGLLMSALSACAGLPLAERLHREKVCHGIAKPGYSEQLTSCLNAEWVYERR